MKVLQGCPQFYKFKVEIVQWVYLLKYKQRLKRNVPKLKDKLNKLVPMCWFFHIEFERMMYNNPCSCLGATESDFKRNWLFYDSKVISENYYGPQLNCI